jgi:hypothetical protein
MVMNEDGSRQENTMGDAIVMKNCRHARRGQGVFRHQAHEVIVHCVLVCWRSALIRSPCVSVSRHSAPPRRFVGAVSLVAWSETLVRYNSMHSRPGAAGHHRLEMICGPEPVPIPLQ